MKILLVDLDLPATRPLSRFCSIFNLRDGIYSPIDRMRKAFSFHTKVEIYFLHPDVVYEKIISSQEGFLAYQSIEAFPKIDFQNWLGNPQKIREDSLSFQESFEQVIFSSELEFLQVFDRIASTIKKDLPHWLKKNKRKSFYRAKNLQILGQKKNIYVHKNCDICGSIVFDSREGPIVVDRAVSIRPFSYLKGPLYIAPNAKLENVNIENSIVGQSTRLGGEIQSSLIGDFSNKHHEGFLGHSIVGNWVNLGALTTTSDLKNNYGEIRLQVPQNISTKRIKLGSLIGDHVKTAIGTFLPSGSVLDVASNIFGNSIEKGKKYIPPFTWGNEKNSLYKQERFLLDTKKIAQRRQQELKPSFYELVQHLYQKVE